MNPITQEPKDQQKVLVDLGNYVDPAVWDARNQRFIRYPNCADGDRCVTYFYSGVIGWCPFPEPDMRIRPIGEKEHFNPPIGISLNATGTMEKGDSCEKPAAEVFKNRGCEETPPWDEQPKLYRFPNGEPRGEDGWPTSASFSSIGL